MQDTSTSSSPSRSSLVLRECIKRFREQPPAPATSRTPLPFKSADFWWAQPDTAHGDKDDDDCEEAVGEGLGVGGEEWGEKYSALKLRAGQSGRVGAGHQSLSMLTASTSTSTLGLGPDEDGDGEEGGLGLGLDASLGSSLYSLASRGELASRFRSGLGLRLGASLDEPGELDKYASSLLAKVRSLGVGFRGRV